MKVLDVLRKVLARKRQSAGSRALAHDEVEAGLRRRRERDVFTPGHINGPGMPPGL
jgi:hypothetical protein